MATPNSQRLFYLRLRLLRECHSRETIYELTGIDPWFLYQMQQIRRTGRTNKRAHISLNRPAAGQGLGFSDIQLAHLTGAPKTRSQPQRLESTGHPPVYKLVDTCAAEFKAATPYYYSTYERRTKPGCRRQKVMILGGGPNRIGQGIEFDYCCVHASFALREEGVESIMVNSNPKRSAPITTPPTSSTSSP
jgi:carbamoyl-phosphate synthase large subunit